MLQPDIILKCGFQSIKYDFNFKTIKVLNFLKIIMHYYCNYSTKWIFTHY